jgi:hypothetical protein
MARAAAASGNPYAPRRRRPIGADPRQRHSSAATRTPDLANAAAAPRNTAPGGDPPRRSIPWKVAKHRGRAGAQAGPVSWSATLFDVVQLHQLHAGDRFSSEKGLGCFAGFLPVRKHVWGTSHFRPAANSSVSYSATI